MTPFPGMITSYASGTDYAARVIYVCEKNTYTDGITQDELENTEFYAVREAPEDEKEGLCRFIRWETDNDEELYPGDNIKTDIIISKGGTLTLYAVWEAHDWGGIMFSGATVYGDSLYSKKCAICESVQYIIWHFWGDEEGESAGCENNGYKTKFCVNCGEEDLANREDYPALGHSWGDWAVEKAASETENGSEARECAGCGGRESREIPILPTKPAAETSTSTTAPSPTETTSAPATAAAKATAPTPASTAKPPATKSPLITTAPQITTSLPETVQQPTTKTAAVSTTAPSVTTAAEAAVPTATTLHPSATVSEDAKTPEDTTPPGNTADILIENEMFYVEGENVYMPAGVNKNDFINGINLNENEEIKVFYANKDGGFEELPEESLIGTGMSVKLIAGGTEKAVFTAVIPGDADGDGLADAGDARLILRHCAMLGNLGGAYFKAADLSKSGEITAAYARTVLRFCAGLTDTLI